MQSRDRRLWRRDFYINELAAVESSQAETRLLLLLLLAGPAVFRGRLRRFGKCTNGVALSKGTPNLASVRLTL